MSPEAVKKRFLILGFFLFVFLIGSVSAANYTVTNTSWHFTNSQGLEIYCSIYLNSPSLYNPLFIDSDTWSNSSTKTEPSARASTWSGYGYFGMGCETRGKGSSGGTADAGGYENLDLYEATQELIRQYPTYVNSSQIYVYGESGAGGKAYMFGVHYPDYANAIAPISGMSDYPLWGYDLDHQYFGDVQYRINTTGPIDAEANLSRNASYGVQNVYSFYAPSHSVGDTAVNYTLSKIFNQSMFDAGQSNLVDYQERVGSTHGSDSDSNNHTRFFFDLKRDPVSVPNATTLKVLGYMQSKKIRVEFLESINKIGEVTYNFSNSTRFDFNLSTTSYEGNTSITIYGFMPETFNLTRNGEVIVEVVNDTVATNNYGVVYVAQDNFTFYTQNVSIGGDDFILSATEVRTPTPDPSYPVLFDGGLNITLCSDYTVPSYDSINFSLGTTFCGQVATTCTYSSGTWGINASENCVIGSDVDLAGNNAICYGTGSLTLNAKIKNFSQIAIDPTCTIYVNSGGGFN